MWPRFKSQHWFHIICVEFIVGSLPCSKRFISRYSGIPISSKSNISKFQFDQELYMKYHYVDVPSLNRYLFTCWYICSHCSRSKQLSLFCLWFKLFWWDHSSCYRPVWWRCLPVPLVRFLVSKVLPFPIHSPDSLQMDTSAYPRDAKGNTNTWNLGVSLWWS